MHARLCKHPANPQHALQHINLCRLPARHQGERMWRTGSQTLGLWGLTTRPFPWIPIWLGQAIWWSSYGLIVVTLGEHGKLSILITVESLALHVWRIKIKQSRQSKLQTAFSCTFIILWTIGMSWQLSSRGCKQAPLPCFTNSCTSSIFNRAVWPPQVQVEIVTNCPLYPALDLENNDITGFEPESESMWQRRRRLPLQCALANDMLLKQKDLRSPSNWAPCGSEKRVRNLGHKVPPWEETQNGWSDLHHLHGDN